MSRTGTILQQRYEIVRLIAEGGMGAVYEGRDLKFDGSPVAIKRCLLTGELMQRAFVREAKLMANISHPSVPKVRDHFAEADGHYLVMEYIAGADLEEILSERGRPVAVDEAINWADRVLEALDYLHSQKPPIIHRDIKPGNIKLTPSGHVILIDFGLAKGNGASSLTGYSANYAPLEQFQDGGTDGQSDLYSLGATIYRLLTGQLPEGALNRVRALARGQKDPLLRINEVNPLVSDAVSQVIWEAMALDKTDRLQSAAEMRRRLHGNKQIQPLQVREGYTPTISVNNSFSSAALSEQLRSHNQIQYQLTVATQSSKAIDPSQAQAQVKVNSCGIINPAERRHKLSLENSHVVLFDPVSLNGASGEPDQKQPGNRFKFMRLAVTALIAFGLVAGVALYFSQQKRAQEEKVAAEQKRFGELMIGQEQERLAEIERMKQEAEAERQKQQEAENARLQEIERLKREAEAEKLKQQKAENARSFAVNASQPWTNTGIKVEPGMEFSIRADGIVSLKNGYNSGPDGNGAADKNSGFPLPGAGLGALIVKIHYQNGRDSNLLEVGKAKRIYTEPGEYGEIMLGINDNWFGDNTGSFQVKVRRIR